MRPLKVHHRIIFVFLSFLSIIVAIALARVVLVNGWIGRLVPMLLFGIAFWFITMAFSNTYNPLKMVLKGIAASSVSVYLYRSVFLIHTIGFSFDNIKNNFWPTLFVILPLFICFFIDDDLKLSSRLVKSILTSFFKGGMIKGDGSYVQVFSMIIVYTVVSVISLFVGIGGLICHKCGLEGMSFATALSYNLDREESIVISFVKAFGMALSRDYTNAFLLLGINIIIILVTGFFIILARKYGQVGFNPFLALISIIIVALLIWLQNLNYYLRDIFFSIIEQGGLQVAKEILHQWPKLILSYTYIEYRSLTSNVAFFLSIVISIIPPLIFWSCIHISKNFLIRLVIRLLMLPVCLMTGLFTGCIIGGMVLNLITGGAVLFIIALATSVFFAYATLLLGHRRIEEVSKYRGGVYNGMDFLDPNDITDNSALRSVARNPFYGFANNEKAIERMKKKDR